MITEDYVSFETAKLLKENGFDWIVTRSFFEHDNCYAPCDPSEVPRKDAIAIPTLQMAMKWLRKMHGIHVGVLVTYQHRPRKYEAHIMNLEEIDDFILQQTVDFDSPEEACEAAIKYCLENLI